MIFFISLKIIVVSVFKQIVISFSLNSTNNTLIHVNFNFFEWKFIYIETLVRLFIMTTLCIRIHVSSHSTSILA